MSDYGKNRFGRPGSTRRKAVVFLIFSLAASAFFIACEFFQEMDIIIPLSMGGEHTHTADFYTFGGSDIPSQRVPPGSPLLRPEDPKKKNALFDNWFTSAERTDVVPYDFSAGVTENLTLYARWDELLDQGPGPAVYVHRSGNDGEDGLSPETSFRTLARAVEAVAGADGSPPLPPYLDIDTVVILSELNDSTEGGSDDSVFRIELGAGSKEITLRGEGGSGAAALRGRGTSSPVLFVGGNSRVILENILIHGGSAGVRVESRAQVVMRNGTITGNNTGVKIGMGNSGEDNGFNSFVSFTLAGGNILNNSVHGIAIDRYSKALMKGGLIGGNGSAEGGALGGGVENGGGFFTIQGGEIANNQAASGGGLYIRDGGKCVMRGGSINRNGGRGAHLEGGGNFTLEDGEISENNGGGLRLGFSAGTFTMTGGSIRDNWWEYGNYDSTKGGGIYAEGGSVDIRGGSISGHYHKFKIDAGGGIYCGENVASFTMSGGTISGNSANGFGGGVYSMTSFTMTGGIITDNFARSDPYYDDGAGIEGNGGGVCVAPRDTDPGANPVVFTLGGGARIEGNRADSNGGGIYGPSGPHARFVKTGGTVAGNSIGSAESALCWGVASHPSVGATISLP